MASSTVTEIRLRAQQITAADGALVRSIARGDVAVTAITEASMTSKRQAHLLDLLAKYLFATESGRNRHCHLSAALATLLRARAQVVYAESTMPDYGGAGAETAIVLRLQAGLWQCGWSVLRRLGGVRRIMTGRSNWRLPTQWHSISQCVVALVSKQISRAA